MKIFMLLMLPVVLSCNMRRGTNASDIAISFKNNSSDVCHFGLIAYKPDGQSVTRVSNVAPYHAKTYRFPIGTKLYLLDKEQEATAMRGIDLRERGDTPLLILTQADNGRSFMMNH